MEEVTISKKMIKYNGIFSLGDLYRMLYDLFTGLKYYIEETRYTRKIKPDGEQVEIIWDCYKKIDDYTRYHFNINVFIVGLKKVQIDVGGKKVSKNTGDITVTIKAGVQTDYLNKWETHPILKFLKGIYDNYIYAKTLRSWIEKMGEELDYVSNEIKAFFNMAAYV